MAKQRGSHQLDRNLRALLIALVVVDFLLVIASMIGSGGEDEGEAQRRVTILRRELSQVQKTIAETKLPASLDVQAIPTAFIDLATKAGIEITSFGSAIRKVPLGGKNYDALIANLEAEGSQQELLNFLAGAEKLNPKGTVINNLEWRLLEATRWRVKLSGITFIQS